MSLRYCEWRVHGPGQTTSKPFIHRVPSYGLQKLFEQPGKKLLTDEILVDENSLFARVKGLIVHHIV